MDLVILLLSPYIPWNNALCSKGDIIGWAVAALAVPYTEEVGWDVVRSLLRSVCHSSLRPHIPIEIWAWLKKHSTLPPPYQGLGIEITSDTVRCVQGLGDVEILKSFFLLAWSECTDDYGPVAMEDSLRGFFCGIGMQGHRRDLTERLDRVVRGCDQGENYLESLRRVRHNRLREVLLEVEAKEVEILVRMLPKLSLFYKYTDT